MDTAGQLPGNNMATALGDEAPAWQPKMHLHLALRKAPAQGRQRKCLEIQGVEAPAQLGVEAPAANPRRENVARNDPANRQWLAKYCGEVLGWAA